MTIVVRCTEKQFEDTCLERSSKLKKISGIHTESQIYIWSMLLYLFQSFIYPNSLIYLLNFCLYVFCHIKMAILDLLSIFAF
jgi:hypothetical protein